MLTQTTNNLTLYLSSWHVYNRWMLSTVYSNCTLQHNQGCFLGFLNASQLAGSGSLNWQGMAPSACDMSCCRTTPLKRKLDKSLPRSTLQPRLAIATHLSVNEYSIVLIISGIRSTYPVGPLAIAQDLNVWDISPTNITQRRYANLFLLYTFVVCLSYAEVGHEDLYISAPLCTILCSARGCTSYCAHVPAGAHILVHVAAHHILHLCQLV